MSKFKLSKQGEELINLYKQMADKGYSRTDGVEVKKAFSDFELRKFRNLCKEKLSQDSIKTVLDYGGGGSNWDEPNFEPSTGETAKTFFNVDEVNTFEPARDKIEKKLHEHFNDRRLRTKDKDGNPKGTSEWMENIDSKELKKAFKKIFLEHFHVSV